MGRQLKRVPLDFDHPINTPWEGYLNPFYALAGKCEHCENGYSPAGKMLNDLWYGHIPFKPEDNGSVPYLPTDEPIRTFAERNVSFNSDYYGTGERDIVFEAERLCKLFNSSWSHHLNERDVRALVKAGRLMDFTHTFKAGEGWKKKKDFVMPTPQQVNDWNLRGMGYDSCNNWVCVDAECKRIGVPSNCIWCGGGMTIWTSKEVEQQCEDWKQTEPPEGDGYQLWENVSEGSPITPVFATPEELANYLISDEYFMG